MKHGRNRIIFTRNTIQLVALTLAVGLFVVAGQSQADWLQMGKTLFSNLSVDQKSELGVTEIGNGLKEALKVGTERVVGQLGRIDGFNKDPAIHIPLP